MPAPILVSEPVPLMPLANTPGVAWFSVTFASLPRMTSDTMLAASPRSVPPLTATLVKVLLTLLRISVPPPIFVRLLLPMAPEISRGPAA